MKKWQIGLIVIAGLILIGFISFKVQYSKMTKALLSEDLSELNLVELKDGTYRGRFKQFLVDVELDVIIKDHIITDIKLVHQNCGKGYEAHDTIDRIIKSQRSSVDATTGATGSSKGIMIAVQRALLSGLSN